MNNLLEVQDLSVTFYTDLGEVHAVKNASFQVNKGEIYGIVGESGSGKSVSTKAIMRINPENGKVESGQALFDGVDVLSLSEKEFRPYRGKRIAMIFQDSLSALNPVYKVGTKMVELLRRLNGLSKAEAAAKAKELLGKVGIVDPERCFHSYPHELSGGMRQRVMIAMAISCNPDLIIADEPTTALDVTIQAQILHMLRDIRKEQGMSMILITHDLGVVAQLCQRVSVMCGGYVVETGCVDKIFHSPEHPYTKALIASMPKTGQEFKPFLEHGVRKEMEKELCPFYERCQERMEKCAEEVPKMVKGENGHCVRCFRAKEVIESE
ncbi:MAG: ABC transporter ATP-binding protein [Eubacteriales bacterium]|nr:ABC transporter ATP-binding protein [Eubacteriales bacterium]